MHCLLYTAKTYKPFDRATLAHILGGARVRNEVAGITGILLYGRSTVMQCLEGVQVEVEKTFARIRRNPRIYDVRVEVSRPGTERLFPNWSMAFERRSEADAITEAIDLGDPHVLPEPGGRFNLVTTMLRNFRDGVALMEPPAAASVA